MQKFSYIHKYKIILGMVCVLFGTLFFILSFIVNKDVFRSIDYDTMVNFQSIIPRSFDLGFSVLTVSGSTEVTVLALFSLLFYIYISRKHAFLSLLMFFLIYIIELAGKLFVFHPLPPPFFNRYALPLHLPSSFIVHTNFSYPSGHMARSTFLVGILLFLILRSKKNAIQKLATCFLLILYFVGMFVSRIYLGEHWLSDVIGGVLLGSNLAALSAVFW